MVKEKNYLKAKICFKRVVLLVNLNIYFTKLISGVKSSDQHQNNKPDLKLRIFSHVFFCLWLLTSKYLTVFKRPP